MAAPLSASAGLAATWFSGYRLWKNRGGLYRYHESGIHHDLGRGTTGAVVVDCYAPRVTGLDYVLGQIFLAGPMRILRACTLLFSRIPHSAELELGLEEILTRIRATKTWQGLRDYPDAEAGILYLAQMELIDLSGYDGKPRFKVR